jgi:hypothetical protein|tara:strand:- start:2690 stop:4894 length:2205 start_codon:yes stop_codon:yes gene_type:complete
MAIEDNKINIKVGMNTRGFQKGMKTVQGGFKKLNGAIGAFTAGFVGTQVFGVVKGLATMAGEAEKTELRFKRVFGSMSTSVSMFSSKLAGDLGRVETDVKSGMVSFQAFFQGLGFAGEEAAGMSQKMQGLSYDLASFFNIQDDNAQKRFLAALAGSPEVLDQFGINLKQAALQTELYNMGIKSTVQNTDELTKTQGRLNIIMRAMTSNGIVGDAERTMNTWDNTVKRTWASIKDLGIAIGNKLLPVLKLFLNAVMSITKAIKGLGDTGNTEIELNQRKKREYEQLTSRLIKYKKSTQSYKLALAELISKYPDFWNNIDTAKISQDKLKEAVEKSTRAFDTQNNVLVQKKGLETQAELVKKLTDELDEYDEKTEAMAKKGPREAFTTFRGTRTIETPAQSKDDFDTALGERATKSTAANELLETEINRLTRAEEAFNATLNLTGLTYEQIMGLRAEGIKDIGGLAADADDLEKQRQKDELERIKNKFDLIKFNNSLVGQNSAELREQFQALEHSVYFNRALVDAGLDYNTQLDHSIHKLSSLQDQLDKMDLFIPIDGIFKVGDVGGQFSKAGEEIKAGAIQMIDILRPITDAMSQIWMQMLTPPDNTISAEEQKEKTMAAFGGIMVGLGQALFSLGTGSLLASMGLDQLGTNPALAIAMIGAGSGLIAIGKGKLQKAKDMGASRTAGGSANSGSGGGNFTGMMEAIQGEQVFRLAGNDLVTALNRTNNFQGAIGG